MTALSSGIGMNGRIEAAGTPALLRTIEKDKLSGELSVKHSNEQISLYFLFGQLYHSRWGQVLGVDAVSELLSWKTGLYTFTEGIVPAQASISDDVERILADDNGNVSPLPRPIAPALSPHSMAGSPSDEIPSAKLDVLIPFDMGELDDNSATTPLPQQSRAIADILRPALPQSERFAPQPPDDGYYRSREFALPAGEQMATSLLATGPELHQELEELTNVGFTGYVLGSADGGSLGACGIAFLKGRFIHAYAQPITPDGAVAPPVTGQQAYTMLLNQSIQSNRYYWFYEMTAPMMHAAMALLNPPTRYIGIEVRILRFKEVLRVLNEESITGCVTITLGQNASIPATHQGGTGHGVRAYIPLYQGDILGMWTYGSPKVVNDGTLLQRFLGEPSARLDLFVSPPNETPGVVLDLVADSSMPRSHRTASQPAIAGAPRQNSGAQSPRIITRPRVDDDTRMEQLVLTVGRMESTWTQMRKKGRIDLQTSLLALGGFANEVIALYESVADHDATVNFLTNAMRNELQPYSSVFHTLDVAQGRVNMIKLLREYTIFAEDSIHTAEGFFREASRALKILIRSVFQTYVREMRSDSARWEGQETFEVFLQEVVWKM